MKKIPMRFIDIRTEKQKRKSNKMRGFDLILSVMQII